MIQLYVDRFMANKSQLETAFIKEHPGSYKDLVTKVIEVLTSDDYNDLDPKRITEIDHGDYQGTLLYIVAAKGYQPSDFWAIKVYYGSCSGCDTLQAIESDGKYGEPPDDSQVKQYMQLALNVVQGLTKIESEGA